MAYSRRIVAEARPSAEDLSAALSGLGVALAVTPIPDANIEDTVLAASQAGMEDDDYRVLGLVVAWLEVHRSRLNADRLIRLVLTLTEHRTTAFWRSRARAWTDDRRWRRLTSLPGPEADLLRVGTAFQLARHGEDPRFIGTGLRVPAGVLRQRPGDVAGPAEVATRHRAYRYRVMMGPGYRADLWALLEQDPDLTPTELARRTYASFATAWQVRLDYQLVCPPQPRSSEQNRSHPRLRKVRSQ